MIRSLFDFDALESHVLARTCITSALEEATQSEDGLTIVVVEGESGVGKSHLLANTDCNVDLRGTGRFNDENDLQAGFLTCIEDLAIQLVDDSLKFNWSEDADILQRFFPRLHVELGLTQQVAKPKAYTALEASERFQSLVSRICNSIFRDQTALLVLDDLQLAASSTMELLSSLCERRVASGDHWAGTVLAFSSRLERSEQLNQWLAEIGGTVPIFRATLENIDEKAIASSLSGKLAPQDRQVLAQQTHIATGGNILRIARYMRWLVEQNAINIKNLDHLDQEKLSSWRNLQEELKELPLGSMADVLGICACFIGPFSADDLEAIVGFDPHNEIRQAINKGWLVELAGHELTFAHDQLRDTAGQHLDVDQHRRGTVKIAKLLLSKRKPLAALLYAREVPLEHLCDHPEQWLGSFIAGADFANTLSSPSLALVYCQNAEKLAERMPASPLVDISILEQRVSAHLLRREYGRLDRLVSQLPSECASLAPGAWARIYSNGLVSLLGQGELRKCTELAIAAAAEQGIEFPIRGNPTDSLEVVQETARLLSNDHSPEPAGPEVAQILSLAIPAFHQFRPDLYPYAAAAIVRQSIGTPAADTLPFGVGVLGIAHALLGDRETGYQFGKRGLALAEAMRCRTSPRTCFAVRFLLDHIVETISEHAVARLDQTTEDATRVGDIDHACYARHLADVYGFFISCPLDKLSERLAEGSQMVRFFGQNHILVWNQVYQQLVENLRSAESPSVLLHGAVFSELIADNSAPYLQYRIHLARLILSVVFGRFSIAIEEAAILQGLARSAGSQYELVPFHFLSAFAHFRESLKATAPQRSDLHRKANFHYQQFRELTQLRAPPPELQIRILKAAFLASSGRTDEAKSRLQGAIDLCDASQWYFEGAIAAEFLAELEDGSDSVAALQTSIRFYERWGATTKVNALKLLDDQSGAIDDHSLISELLSAPDVDKLLNVLKTWISAVTDAEAVHFCFYGSWSELKELESNNVPLSVRRDIARFDDIFDAHNLAEFGRFQGDSQIIAAGVEAFFAIPLRNATRSVGIVYGSSHHKRQPIDPDTCRRLVHTCQLVVRLVDGKLLHQAMEVRVREHSVALTQRDSALRATREEIRKLEQASWTSMIVGGLSHELSTPLASARMIADILQETLLNDVSPQDERIAHLSEVMPTLLQSLDQMACRIQNASSRITNRNFLNRTVFSLRKLVEAIVDSLRVSLPGTDETNVTIDVPEGIKIDGFASLTEQMLENLLSNAFEHGAATSDSVGRIEIHAATQANWIQLKISDNGNSAVEHNRFFKPFDKQSAQSTGIGLGLHIAQSIANGPLGGTIEAHKNDDRGTSVAVNFPMAAPELPSH